jgi:hypothetical protein
MAGNFNCPTDFGESVQSLVKNKDLSNGLGADVKSQTLGQTIRQDLFIRNCFSLERTQYLQRYQIFILDGKVLPAPNNGDSVITSAY